MIPGAAVEVAAEGAAEAAAETGARAGEGAAGARALKAAEGAAGARPLEAAQGAAGARALEAASAPGAPTARRRYERESCDPLIRLRRGDDRSGFIPGHARAGMRFRGGSARCVRPSGYHEQGSYLRGTHR